MTRVSVIVPTYDRADVLPRAIDSVLAQTVEDLELLVVDDASTDETPELVADYDDRVTLLRHDENRGACAARNTGIEAAEGDYVAFLDSDDVWHEAKLERQLDRLVQEDDWVAAYCDYERELPGAGGTFEEVVAALLGNEEDKHKEGGRELIGDVLADTLVTCAGSTLVVERAVAEEIGGFDVTLDRFQDPEFVVRVLEAGKLAYVDETLVTLYGTGSPAPEVIRRADEQYLAKHADLIEEFEERGHDVRATHDLLLAKEFYADGKPLAGTRHLRSASVEPSQYPGVAWAAVSGLRRERGPVATAAGAFVLAAAFAVGLLAFGAARRP
ncbi:MULTISPECIES: glycosyltransferase family 2 protein [Halorussus]|uniref:glycosyltransferase family 2 protein n=1 Tax=Halorussus TaxID=1070314 RepID=UPI0020A0BA45|nr:glycosyltransferase [Halorussus vallis]USZ78405.1 glycosyltransferase [Halorussus vallis]